MDDRLTRVLIVEGNSDEASILASYLSDPGDHGERFTWTHASRVSTALNLLSHQQFDVVLLDLVVPQNVGLEGFRKIHAAQPGIPVIVLTGLQDVPLAVQAVKLGAYDYFIKGSPDCCMIKRAVRYSIERKRVVSETETAVAGELGTLQQTLHDSRREAEIRDYFMNAASHDMRNTLATLTTAAYCLEGEAGGPLTAHQRRLVEMLTRNLARQTRIFEHVLNLARFQSGRLKVQYGTVDVAGLVARMVGECASTGEAPRLRVAVDGGLPEIQGDSSLIRRAIHILVDNALRFAKRTVTVTAARAGTDSVSIDVVDDGEGVPEELLPMLFSGAPRPGSGLGLAVCREIIEGHRGRIWAANDSGRGARFGFVLPIENAAAVAGIVEEDADDAAPRPAETSQLPLSPTYSGHK